MKKRSAQGVFMKKIWGKRVLLPDGWAQDTEININQMGQIDSIVTDTSPSGLEFDTLLPAPMNLHSHCFQRAMTGLSETSTHQSNDFWSWREFMYKFLNAISPENFEAICAFAQMEMLEAGYGGLTEFHYVHNDLAGNRYNERSEMSQRVINASYLSGIGLTLLPVLYEHGGISGSPLISGQDRFGLNFEEYYNLVNQLNSSTKNFSDVKVGVAAHSLRAVKPESLIELQKQFSGYPIHIHVAEQVKEVQEIEQNWGRTPIEWLIENTNLNHDWCLIHCTQMSDMEATELAKSGAVIGLCPITEANLGDGIFNGKTWLEAGGRFGIGTDSNVSISLFGELKMLEYSQRLKQKSRLAMKTGIDLSIGRELFDGILEGGAMSSGRKCGLIKESYWADILALDLTSMHYSHLKDDEKLNYIIFSESSNVIDSVFSAGRHVVNSGQHFRRKDIESAYKKALKQISNIL